jgi:hypothetical protein
MTSFFTDPIEEMGVTNVPALIARTYRESHAFQWAREAWANSIEAGAERVRFGIEWQGVENKGVYRRIIVDDGCGLTPVEIAMFLNNYGGGGKPIGGEHENFGIGFKSLVLPWNQYGVVIATLKDGVTTMAWIKFNERKNSYGLKQERLADGSMATTYAPYHDLEHGIDWRTILPDWVINRGHGTAFVLMGNDPKDDTMLGAPDRAAEQNVSGLANYLNSRIWCVNETHISVEQVNSSNKLLWPRSRADRVSATVKNKWQVRTIRGARHYITEENNMGKVTDSGTVEVHNSEILWYLRSGVIETSSQAQFSGYVALLYKNELYQLSTHANTFRQWGVPASIKNRVFIVVRTKEFDGHSGVYPDSSRTTLKMGGSGGGSDVPTAEFADAFRQKLPKSIADLIRAQHQATNDFDDEEWRRKFAERFGAKWRITKPIFDPRGNANAKLVQPVQQPGLGNSGQGGGIREGASSAKVSTGYHVDKPTESRSAERKIAGGLPRCEFIPASQMGEGMEWSIATWQPGSALEPGVVYINRDHPVITRHIQEFQDQYPQHYEETIADEVLQTYGRLAVAHIAHSEQMLRLTSRQNVDALRSDVALTMALLGMWQVEAIIAPQLGGKLGKVRREITAA